jgi:hypothetical protein
MYWGFSGDTFYQVLLTLTLTKKALDNALWVASAVLNTAVCVDLILLIWHPLSPKAVRTKYYFTIAMIVSIIVFIVSFILTQNDF